MKCLVSRKSISLLAEVGVQDSDLPWVTKLPKFRPTMQCHVAPFLESNFNRADQLIPSHTICFRAARVYLFFDILCYILHQRSSAHARSILNWTGRRKRCLNVLYLLDTEFCHCFRSYKPSISRFTESSNLARRMAAYRLQQLLVAYPHSESVVISRVGLVA